jgi:hypothetical protein
LKNEIERLRSTSAVITPKLTPANALIQLDGAPIAARNGELVVGPGTHRFYVSADGYQPYDQTMPVQAGKFTLEVTLQPTAAGAAPIVAPVAPAAAAAAAPAPAAPPSAAAAAAPPPPPAESAPPGEDECSLGSVCMGPTFDLGVPNLLGGGFHLRIGKYFGASVDFQVLPSITIKPATVHASLFSIDGRIYPFGGALFLAFGFGYQSLYGRVDDNNVAAEATIGLPAFLAGIGFMGHDGFVMGIDLDLLVPLGSKKISVRELSDPTTAGLLQSQVDKVKADARKGVDKVLNALPLFVEFNLIRVGYLF